MEEYQERVIEEKAALEEKLEKLNLFLRGDKFRSLTSVEQNLLQRQAVFMTGYAGVLEERVRLIIEAVENPG